VKVDVTAEAEIEGRRRVILRAKRVIDVVVSAIGLLVLAAVHVVIALAIKASSRGPVLFRQERAGLGGRPFTLLKFRSMAVGSDRSKNVSPTGDPRVTAVGRVLRATYLDELPQLLNVLRGDMSLVGPRPETPEFVALYTDAEREILSIRPGLVGPSTLAFVDEAELLAMAEDPAAFYETTLLHERARLDLEYVRRPSLLLDARIVLLQIWAILRHRPMSAMASTTRSVPR